MAILECSRSTFAAFEAGKPRGKFGFWARLIAEAAGHAACMLASAVFFTAAYPIVKCLPATPRQKEAQE